MNVCEIDGVYKFNSVKKLDNRGFFQNFHLSEKVIDDFDISWKQINFSHNALKGTVRGLHVQIPPFEEWKLVRCIRGSILDILLDCRRGSSSFGKLAKLTLSQSEDSILVPPGVAHGYQVLEDNSDLIYLHSSGYSQEHSKGIDIRDPELGIRLPMEVSTISLSDRNLPSFRQFLGENDDLS